MKSENSIPYCAPDLPHTLAQTQHDINYPIQYSVSQRDANVDTQIAANHFPMRPSTATTRHQSASVPDINRAFYLESPQQGMRNQQKYSQMTQQNLVNPQKTIQNNGLRLPDAMGPVWAKPQAQVLVQDGYQPTYSPSGLQYSNVAESQFAAPPFSRPVSRGPGTYTSVDRDSSLQKEEMLRWGGILGDGQRSTALQKERLRPGNSQDQERSEGLSREKLQGNQQKEKLRPELHRNEQAESLRHRGAANEPEFVRLKLRREEIPREVLSQMKRNEKQRHSDEQINSLSFGWDIL